MRNLKEITKSPLTDAEFKSIAMCLTIPCVVLGPEEDADNPWGGLIVKKDGAIIPANPLTLLTR